MVTGGAGFLGSNIVNELLGLGEEVVIFDNGFRQDFTNIEKFLVSDSIPQIENCKLCNKLEVFSISGLMSNVIKRIQNEYSRLNMQHILLVYLVDIVDYFHIHLVNYRRNKLS